MEDLSQLTTRELLKKLKDQFLYLEEGCLPGYMWDNVKKIVFLDINE